MSKQLSPPLPNISDVPLFSIFIAIDQAMLDLVRIFLNRKLCVQFYLPLNPFYYSWRELSKIHVRPCHSSFLKKYQ